MKYLRNVSLTKLYSIFVFLFALLINPLKAQDPLLDAIKAFEENDLKKASILFKPFLRGNPIAKPYCDDLMARGLLSDDYPHTNVKDFKQTSIAYAWYEASCLLREAKLIENEIAKQEKKLEKKPQAKRDKVLKPLRNDRANCFAKLLKLKTPVAGWHVGNLYARKVFASDHPDADADADAANYYSKTFLSNGKNAGYFNTADGCFEPRPLFALLKTKRVKDIVHEEMILDNILLEMEKALEVSPLSTVLFDLSQRYKGKPVEKLFLRSAAYYGSTAAQFEMAKNYSKSEQEIFFWCLQAAQGGIVDACDQVAKMLVEGKDVKANPEQCVFYSKLTLELCGEYTQKNSAFYSAHSNRLLLLGKKEEAIKAFEFEILNGVNDERQFDYSGYLHKWGMREEEKKVLRRIALNGHILAMNNLMVLEPTPDDLKGVLPIALDAGKTNPLVLKFIIKLWEKSPLDIKESLKQRVFHLLKDFSKSQDKDTKGSALHKLGYMLVYYNKDGVFEGNPFECLNEAVSLGYHEAYYLLGHCYEHGLGVEINLAKALEHFENAIRHGNSGGLNTAAKVLMDFETNEADIKALDYLDQAYLCDTGSRPFVAFNLLIMHSYGRGGAAKDPSLIKKYHAEAIQEPTLKLIANHVLAEFLAITSHDYNAAEELIEEGVTLRTPDALMLKGQLLLLNPLSDESKEMRRLAISYIFESAKMGNSIARPLFAYFTSVGVEGALRADVNKANTYLKSFTEKEISTYEFLLENFYYSKRQKEKLATVQEEKKQEPTEESNSDESEEVEVNDVPVLDLPVVEEEIVDRKPNPRMERIEAQLASYKGKKQVKWRKVRSLMGKAMATLSGSFKSGKGSGHHIEIGGIKSSMHIPHGANPTELKGGRLKNLEEQIAEGLNKGKEKTEGSINNNNNK